LKFPTTFSSLIFGSFAYQVFLFFRRTPHLGTAAVCRFVAVFTQASTAGDCLPTLN